MPLLPLALGMVLSTMHYEGDVTAAGGDYAVVELAVPAGTREIRIAHTDGSDYVILDWGVWAPEGFRGWGGGNTEDAIIGADESSRSYRPGPITPGTWKLVIGKAQLDATGGHYAVDVEYRDAGTLPVRARAPFAPVVLPGGRRWYKGDFHVHSAESGDATATLDQIEALARTRGLDFVNLSDHNTDSHLALAAAAQAAQAAQGRLPGVLLLRGAEITTYAGHGNAVGLGAYVDHRIGFEGRTIEQVIDDVAAQGAVFLVNHPSLDLGDSCIGCAWKHPTTPWDKVTGLEVITGKWDVVERLFVPRAMALWDELAAQGHRIAAVGGSDDHRAGAGTGVNDAAIGSPTTLVLADELSEAAILEGLRRGRTIVQLRGPDDPLVGLRIGEAEIGDDVEGVEVAGIEVSVAGGEPGMFVQVWRDGEKIAQAEVTGAAFSHHFEDRPGSAERRYRVELVNAGNQRLVVTSHLYVHGVSGGGGCGCGGASGSGAGSALGALVAMRLGRRRRPPPG